jgi:CheY-like chemotaxis protein
METRPGHILIVDDDPLNRKLLEKSLEASGHHTIAADNGFAGLSAIDDDAPDLILLDIVSTSRSS